MHIELYFSVAAGVVASVILPILIRSVKDEFNSAVPAAKTSSRFLRFIKAAWPHCRKYIVLLFFSLLTSILIVAVLWDAIIGWKTAFLAGYAWDSTIQKITQKP